jgi:hypothetical protein
MGAGVSGRENGSRAQELRDKEAANQLIAQALTTLYQVVHNHHRERATAEEIERALEVIRTAGYRVRSLCGIEASFSGYLADERRAQAT